MEDHLRQQERESEGNGKVVDDGAKIITSGSGVDGDEVPVSPLPPEIMESDLLPRLPAKSLMRFKCVSKLWRSTISQPSFIKAHNRQRSRVSGGLFVTYPDDGYLRCLYATLPIGESISLQEQFSLPDLSKYKYSGVTRVIQGRFFCLYADNRSWICNISTREIRELPVSDLQGGMEYNYFLGFSSTSKEYKLLKTCAVNMLHGHADCSIVMLKPQCEILTLGENTSWRGWISSYYQDIHSYKQAVYIADLGLLCWWHSSGRNFVIFNFQKESFHWIDPPERASSQLRSYLLLQFEGKFALAREMKICCQGMELEGVLCGALFHRKLELWVLELNYPRGQSLSPYKWIYRVINLPFDFPLGGIRFLGILPTTGEMLLTGIETNCNSDLPVYSYDHTSGEFEKFIIGKFRSSPFPAPASICKHVNKFHICYYQEDITPLSDLMGNEDSSTLQCPFRPTDGCDLFDLSLDNNPRTSIPVDLVKKTVTAQFPGSGVVGKKNRKKKNRSRKTTPNE